jgi:hypothetical protein
MMPDTVRQVLEAARGSRPDRAPILRLCGIILR